MAQTLSPTKKPFHDSAALEAMFGTPKAESLLRRRREEAPPSSSPACVMKADGAFP